MNIAGKNIILTGASSGIGLEILKLLLKYENTRIIAVARHTDTIREIKDKVFAYSADIGNKEEIDNLFSYAHTKLGSIDIFIANAGFAYMEKLSYPDWDHNKKIFEVNTLSPIYSLQKLITQANRQELYFVFLSSAVSKVVLPYYSLYCSTKAAIRHFVEAYRYEAPNNIHIACVYPVATKTNFFERATKEDNPTLPFLTQNAHTVAKSILKGIEMNKKNIYPSTLFRLFEIAGRLLPFIFTIYSKREKVKMERRQSC